jgi:hypothetical protein
VNQIWYCWKNLTVPEKIKLNLVSWLIFLYLRTVESLILYKLYSIRGGVLFRFVWLRSRHVSFIQIAWIWFVTFQLFVELFCLHKSELSSLFNGRELYSNNITGKIPEELGNLTNLVSLDLYLNYLSGNIPSTLGNLKKLRFL